MSIARDPTSPRKTQAGARPGVLIDNLEVCRLLGIKPDTFRKRVSRGQAPLPHSVMGARSYYRTRDIRHYLTHGTWPPGTRFRYRQPEPSAE
jgi:hypothetical protein